MSTAIRVLVVEDDPLLAGAHQELVGRAAGFECIGVAHSGAEALRFLAAREVDLVLLDVYLPDMTGLDVLQALRAGGLATDVVAVTSARDLDVVRAAVSQVAEDVGISRVTARRYLEHLAEQRLASRSPRYGGAGRPEYLYGCAT